MNRRMKQVTTTEQAINLATTSLANDICTLSARKDTALSVFRKTATDLQTINNGLREKLNSLAELAVFIEEQQTAANTLIHDNEAVRTRILDIIGE